MACWSAKMLDFMKNEVSKWIGAISLEEFKKYHWVTAISDNTVEKSYPAYIIDLF